MNVVAATANSELPTFFLEFGLLLLVLGALARVAHMLSMSAVPLYLLAGLLFGDGGVFGVEVSDGFLEVVAELGVLILLLLLGLEYSGPCFIFQKGR